ncbi:MAG: diacylglycerol kinase family lipid kinase [Clostridia bacterium]|nr:diacylglycerol kinase family lipid kinase [Clostridia bacterium]
MAAYLLICNPIAGNGAAKDAIVQAQSLLDEAGADYQLRYSEYPGHTVLLAEQAVSEGHGCIVAVGGDGTVREVALALIGTQIPLGIIPCGTGNDYVRPLGIPRDIEKAVDILLHGKKRQVDAGKANGQLFINVAGFGFDVDVLDSTEIFKRKYKHGNLAYLRGLLHALSKLRLRKTHITLPDREMDSNVLIIAIGNGTHFGGGMKITPEADPSDGLLDVCIAHDVSKFTVLRVLPQLLKGTHLKSKYVTYFRTESIEARCEPVSRIEVDGEVMEGTPISIEIIKNAMTVMVGTDA